MIAGAAHGQLPAAPFSGEIALNASLGYTRGVAVDTSGNVFFSHDSATGISQVQLGQLFAVAGSGASGYWGDNGPATLAGLRLPLDLALDNNNGDIYVADSQNYRIRKVSQGRITTAIGTGGVATGCVGGPFTSTSIPVPYGIAFDSTTGWLFFSAPSVHCLFGGQLASGAFNVVVGSGQGYSADGYVALTQINTPKGLAIAPAFMRGNTGVGVIFAEQGNGLVRMVADGMLTTLAGTVSNFVTTYDDNVPATSTKLLNPVAVGRDAAGILYIIDGTLLRTVDAIGMLRTIAGGHTAPTVLSGPGLAFYLGEPTGLHVSPEGLVTLADVALRRIIRVGANVTCVVSGTLSSSNSPTPSRLFVVSASSTTHSASCTASATASASASPSPSSSSPAVTQTCQMLRSDDLVFVIAGGVAGNWPTVLNGQSATTTAIGLPASVWSPGDDSGEVWFAELDANRVSKISNDGRLFGVAGNGAVGYTGDGGPASAAALAHPSSLTAMSTASGPIVYFVDMDNMAIRRIVTSPAAPPVIDTVLVGSDDNGTSTELGACVDGYVVNGTFGIPNHVTWGFQTLFATFMETQCIVSIDFESMYATVVVGNGTRGYSADTSDLIVRDSLLWRPLGLHFKAPVHRWESGTLLFTEAGNKLVRSLRLNTLTTVAGSLSLDAGSTDDGIPATSARLFKPTSVGMDVVGNIYIVDDGSIRVVNTAGIMRTLVNSPTASLQTFGPGYNFSLSQPVSIHVSPAGLVYVADGGNDRLLRVGAQTSCVPIPLPSQAPSITGTSTATRSPSASSTLTASVTGSWSAAKTPDISSSGTSGATSSSTASGTGTPQPSVFTTAPTQTNATTGIALRDEATVPRSSHSTVIVGLTTAAVVIGIFAAVGIAVYFAVRFVYPSPKGKEVSRRTGHLHRGKRGMAASTSTTSSRPVSGASESKAVAMVTTRTPVARPRVSIRAFNAQPVTPREGRGEPSLMVANPLSSSGARVYGTGSSAGSRPPRMSTGAQV